jgi:hypothetical protein
MYRLLLYLDLLVKDVYTTFPYKQVAIFSLVSFLGYSLSPIECLQVLIFSTKLIYCLNKIKYNKYEKNYKFRSD